MISMLVVVANQDIQSALDGVLPPGSVAAVRQVNCCGADRTPFEYAARVAACVEAMRELTDEEVAVCRWMSRDIMRDAIAEAKA